MKKLDLRGLKFGLLTVVEPVKVGRDAGWVCICDCGVEVSIVTGSLTAGKSKSCGCLRRSVNRKKSTTHGFTKHPLMAVFKNMIQRCYNVKSTYYKNYGGRGIRVSSVWLNDPAAFFSFALNSGWKYDLTIDRLDNDGDYEPGNCRFVTRAENNKNRNSLQSNNSTGFSGVSYNKRAKKYRAYIKNKHLGYFLDAESAANAISVYESTNRYIKHTEVNQ